MTDIAQTRAAFIEKIGLVAQGEGMPRSAGRLFGLLVFDGGEHAFGRLAEALSISRGNVSASVRFLEERGLVVRTARAGDRQDYFKLADDPFETLTRDAQNRTIRAAKEIEKCLDALPADAADVRARLAAHAGFYRAIVTGLDHALTELATSPDGQAHEGDRGVG